MTTLAAPSTSSGQGVQGQTIVVGIRRQLGRTAVDMNMSLEVAAELRRQGHDAVHGASFDTLAALAAQDEREFF